LIFGSIFPSGFGDHERHIGGLRFVASESGVGIRVYFTPYTGMGDAWFGIYRNSELVSLVYADEGAESFAFVQGALGGDTQNIQVIRNGFTQGQPMPRTARYFDSASERAALSWKWIPEIIGLQEDDGTENPDLSNWSLSGLTTSIMARTDDTRGYLGVSIAVSGGTATVTVSNSGVSLASGSVAVGDSGLSGTVDVAAGAATESGMILRIRWPEYANILRDTSSPPSTDIDDVYFDWDDYGEWAEESDLAAGTYYYAIQAISDTGQAGTQTSPASVTISASPEPPTELAYASGDASATILSFTGSATPGATYAVYLQEPDQEFMDVVTPAATAIAGATQITLPAISGYAGYAYAWLRATSGGVEEQTGARIRLEYDAAGAYVAERPNDASLASVTSDGTTVTATVVYDSTSEEGTGATARVFTRTPGGSFNRASPAQTGALASSIGNLKTATLTWTSGTGWIEVGADVTTSGSVASVNVSNVVRHYVSTTGGTTPTEFEADNARG